MSCLKSAFNSPGQAFKNLSDFELNWRNSLTSSSTTAYANQISTLHEPASHNVMTKNLQILSQYSQVRSLNPLLFNSTKWMPSTLATVNKLQAHIRTAFNLNDSKIRKISNDLYYVEPG